MKKLKSLFNFSKTQLVTAAAMTSVVLAPGAFAEDIDFSTMAAGVASATAVTAIVSMGVVKIAPNFAKWAVNKVASFF